MSRTRGRRAVSRRLSARPASTGAGRSDASVEVAVRSLATSSAAPRPRPAHTANTAAAPPSAISAPAISPAAAKPAASTQPTSTLAAVSWSGVAATEGISVACAGRIPVYAAATITTTA